MLVRYLERQFTLGATLPRELHRQEDAFRQLMVKTEIELSGLRQNAGLRVATDEGAGEWPPSRRSWRVLRRPATA